jgi:hypothetical protein
VILAIVGSRELSDGQAEAARLLITSFIRYYDNIRVDELKVISGGADGVDTIALQAAWELDVNFEEFRPTAEELKLPGFAAFKPRNIRVAETCDNLICVQSVLAHPRIAETTYGAGWTYDYAKSIRKIAQRYWV